MTPARPGMPLSASHLFFVYLAVYLVIRLNRHLKHPPLERLVLGLKPG